jgi:hypothetical protein
MAIVAQVIGGFQRDRREECILGYGRVLKMTCLSLFMQKRQKKDELYVLFQFHVSFYSDVYSVSKLPVPLVRTTNKHYTIHNTVVLSDTHNPQPITKNQ